MYQKHQTWPLPSAQLAAETSLPRADRRAQCDRRPDRNSDGHEDQYHRLDHHDCKHPQLAVLNQLGCLSDQQISRKYCHHNPVEFSVFSQTVPVSLLFQLGIGECCQHEDHIDPEPKFTHDFRTILRQFLDLQQSYDNWRIHRTFTTISRPILRQHITITFRHLKTTGPDWDLQIGLLS